MNAELFEQPCASLAENPSDAAMRHCRQVEVSLATCVRSIAGSTTPRARLLAAWELVNSLVTDNSLMGIEDAIDHSYSVWMDPYSEPANLTGCFDDDGGYSMREGEDLSTDDLLDQLMEVIARMPNAATRERMLACVVACVRREPLIDLWITDILWFLQKAPSDYLIDWQEPSIASAAPTAIV